MKEVPSPAEQRSQEARHAIVESAKSMIGWPPYKTGSGGLGMDPSMGMNCLGMVAHALRLAEVELCDPDGNPRPIQGMGTLFRQSIFTPHEEAQPGDLAFSVYVNSESRIVASHVGIYVGGGTQIHSPGLHGSRIGSAEIEYPPFLPDSIQNLKLTGAPRIMFRRTTDAPWKFRAVKL